MVAAGFFLIGLGLWFSVARWWRKSIESPWLLRALAIGSPLGFLALEAGWVVTELGRQPWTVYGIMRTRDAVTPSADVMFSFIGFSLLYAGLVVALIALLRGLAGKEPHAA
jgi:cytochrome d ubiquinol oxidase subunit I